jgi:hypothetical protein
VAVLVPLYVSRPKGRSTIRRPGLAHFLIGIVAVMIGSATGYAVLPSGGCDGHGGSEELTGPLVPIDGHSMLSRKTGVAESRTNDTVGLVVGLLKNCGSSPLTIRSARLISVTNYDAAARSGSFWVVGPAFARPGTAIAEDVLPLAKGVDVLQSREVERYPGLVLLVESVREGDFSVNAVSVTYTDGNRTYTSPYATIARLRIPGHAEKAGASSKPLPT